MNREEKFPLNQKNGGLAFSAMIVIYLFIILFLSPLVDVLFLKNSTAYVLVGSTFSIIAMAIVILVKAISDKNQIEKPVFNLNVFKWQYLIIAILLCGGMLFGLGFLNQLVANLLVLLGANVNNGANYVIDTPLKFIAFSFFIAVLPAVFEEIFFRSLLLTSLKKAKPITAVITVALCFALYHATATQFVYQFIFGALLCVLAIISKSVIPCIIAHFLNNFIIILFEYLKIKINLFNPLIIAVGCITLLIAVAFIIFTLKKQGVKNSGESVKAFYFPYGVLGLGACLALIIGSLFIGG